MVLGHAHLARRATVWGSDRAVVGQADLAALWAMGAENREATEDGSNWGAHIQEARNLLAGRAAPLGRRPKDAFNSPFLPFVLVTTAVGQEGLDFHCYSHAVVHWNLPANPVDLEQREGRVHRYKGHAIRKNVARRFGLAAIREAAHDPWTDIFAAAAAERPDGMTDLVPYWLYPINGGAYIEHHVPTLPLAATYCVRRRCAVLWPSTGWPSARPGRRTWSRIC